VFIPRALLDVWSVGCVFGELFKLRPLFKGIEEKADPTNRSPFQREQLTKIFDVLGFPDKSRWPGIDELPEARQLQTMRTLQKSQLDVVLRVIEGDGWSRQVQIAGMEHATKLMSKMLEFDPTRRISAEQALHHVYFAKDPKPSMK
jgi:cyclin-dependent kinase 8/11